MAEAMSKQALLQAFETAYEQLIDTALEGARRGVTRSDGWGAREIVAHLAGWEVMATVRIPAIVGGMPPLEESSPEREEVMNAAINATIVTMIGDQPLEAVIDILRRTYRRNHDLLRALDDRFFQPGEYVYERTKGVIEHCQEHGDELAPGGS